MIQHKKIYAFIVVFFLFFGYSFAQSDTKYVRINRNDGLAHNNVYSITQDKYGFIWFATQDGLNRYDGYSFKHFYNEPNNTNSISSSNFGVIYFDTKGFLWLGTYRNGLDKYNTLTGEFEHYKFNENDTNSISSNKIRAITEDINGNLWIGTSDGGLCKLNKKKKNFTRYKHSENDINSLSSNDVNGIFADKHGNVWIATDEGVDYFNTKKNLFQHYVVGSESYDMMKHLAINTVIVDKNGTVWLGSSNGVFTIDPISKQTKNYTQDISNPNSLGSNLVNVIFEDSYGTIWVGTENGGLNKFIAETETFENFNFDIKDYYSISSNRIWSIFEDKSKILWIGTKGGGVNKLDLKRKKFHHLQYNNNKKNGLSHPSVSAIIKDNKENIWIGTDGGGICLYSKENKIIKKFIETPFDKTTLSDNQVWAICRDSNKIWVGTHTGGLNKIEYTNEKYEINQYKQNRDNQYSISNNQINVIFKDNENVLWIGTRNGLNVLIDTLANNELGFVTINNIYTDTENSLSSDYITSIYQDHFGYLWIGTYTNGLNRLNKKTGKIIKYKNVSNNNKSLSSNNIQTIFEDHYGNLWVGTVSGLNKFSEKSKNFKRYTIKNGMPSNEIMAILEDNYGFLWISTANGLTKLNPHTDKIINFNMADGLYSVGFNWNSAYKDEKGKLYFGTNSGMLSFEPSEIKLNSFIPKIVITKFSIIKNDKWVSNDMFISKFNSDKSSIVLDYNNNIFSVEFAAMDFTNPEQNTFQYKIEDIDDNWIDYGKKRFIMVTNLKPGNYVLKIRGTNNDNVLNKKGIELKIKIKPPFWNSIWFYIVATIAAILIIIWIYSFLVELKTNKILEDKNLQLEETNKKLIKSETNLKLLNDTKDKFFSVIAHDLRNPFNPLLSLTELLDDDYDDFEENERRDFIKEIRKGAKKLHTLLENLLNWALSQTKQIKFNKEKLNINILINKNIDLLTINAEERNIIINNKLGKDAYIFADENMINSVIRNLINNAIKFSKENSEINIFVKEKNNKYVIEVEDKGIGISKENLSYIFNGISKKSGKKIKGAGSGLGLMLCKDFVTQNGGKIWVTSKFNIGTIFYFTVNKYQNHQLAD